MEVRRHPAPDLPSHVAAWLRRQTLFGSIEFASLWDIMGGRAVYWVVYDDDRLVALLPGVQFGRGHLARLQAMPDGLYGRLFFVEGGVNRDEVARMTLDAVASAGYARVFINDYYSKFGDHDEFEVQASETSLVDVSRADWQPPDAKLRSEIRKAQREDTSVREFSLARHFDAFVALMKQTEQRHGRRPKYPPEFYRGLGKLAMLDTRVRWLVCEQDDELAASHIYFVEDDMLLNWQVFFDKRFSSLKPNQSITFSVVSEPALRGIRMLNLGATPEGAESLSYYKDKWGGELYRYRCLRRQSWLGRLL